MEKFIPYEKRSKKEQRRWNNARRGTWGAVKPVTRAPKNSRAYDRRKAQNWKREAPDSVPFVWNFSRAQSRRAHSVIKTRAVPWVSSAPAGTSAVTQARPRQRNPWAQGTDAALVT